MCTALPQRLSIQQRGSPAAGLKKKDQKDMIELSRRHIGALDYE